MKQVILRKKSKIEAKQMCVRTGPYILSVHYPRTPPRPEAPPIIANAIFVIARTQINKLTCINIMENNKKQRSSRRVKEIV